MTNPNDIYISMKVSAGGGDNSGYRPLSVRADRIDAIEAINDKECLIYIPNWGGGRKVFHSKEWVESEVARRFPLVQEVTIVNTEASWKPK